MLEGIAIEVKVAGRLLPLVRQLQRYAEHPHVHELLVVTNRRRLTGLPETLNGKPVTVLNLSEIS